MNQACGLSTWTPWRLTTFLYTLLASVYPATSRLHNVSRKSEISNSRIYLTTVTHRGMDGVSSLFPHKALQHLVFTVSYALTIASWPWCIDDTNPPSLRHRRRTLVRVWFWVGYLPWDISKIEIELQIAMFFSVLNQSPSVSSSTSGIQPNIYVENKGVLRNLFSPDVECSTLDKVLASEKFCLSEEGCFGLWFGDERLSEFRIQLTISFWRQAGNLQWKHITLNIRILHIALFYYLHLTAVYVRYL